MEFLIRHEFRNLKINNNDFYVSNFFNKLYTTLEKKHPNHTFTKYLNTDYSKYGQGGISSCMNFSIINPDNGNYILISFFDNWKYHFMKHMGWDPKKMKQFFYPGGFNFYDYFTFKKKSETNFDVEFPEDIKKTYQQFYYQPYFDCCYDLIDDLYQKRKFLRKNRSLFFRGWMWDFRKKMMSNVSQNDILIFDKNNNGDNLDYKSYLNEISNYYCSLSLPGGNEICNRDIECFGIGSPVIRPSLNINYEDPLIPNYHYISCYQPCDYSIDGNPKYLSYEDFGKSLISTWNSVKNNDEYLDFISENARFWFLRNCKMENNLNYVINKIDINCLI